MAKKASKTERSLTRKQLARRERDERQRRLLIWSAVGVGALILIVLGFGLVSEYVLKPNTAVAKVGDVAITAKEFQARVRYERMMAQSQLTQYDSFLAQLDATDPNQQALIQQIQTAQGNLQNQLSPDLATLFGGQVLDQMLDEEIVRQESAKRGISATQDEVDLQVEQFIGYDREADVGATEVPTDTVPPMTFDEYTQSYEGFKTNYLEAAGFSEAAFRKMLETQVLQQKLQDEIGQEVDTEADQIQATVFAASTEEIAQTYKDRLDAGEDPAVLTDEIQNDGDDTTIVVDTDWRPVGYLSSQYGPEVERAAFNTDIGKASEPILGLSDRYYVLLVLGHEVRPLDAYTLQQRQQERYDTWLAEQRNDNTQYLDWQKFTPSEP